MLKPQDIPILLKTHLWQDRQWRYSDLAESLAFGNHGKNQEVSCQLFGCELKIDP
jgi:hypothetical protein